MTFKTEQDALWAGDFGHARIQRQQGNALLASNLPFLRQRPAKRSRRPELH